MKMKKFNGGREEKNAWVLWGNGTEASVDSLAPALMLPPLKLIALIILWAQTSRLLSFTSLRGASIGLAIISIAHSWLLNDTMTFYHQSTPCIPVSTRKTLGMANQCLEDLHDDFYHTISFILLALIFQGLLGWSLCTADNPIGKIKQKVWNTAYICGQCYFRLDFCSSIWFELDLLQALPAGKTR